MALRSKFGLVAVFTGLAIAGCGDGGGSDGGGSDTAGGDAATGDQAGGDTGGGGSTAGDGVWAQESFVASQNLHAVFAIAADDVWVGGDGGIVAHWDGAAWTESTTGQSKVADLWAGGGDDVWAAGAGASVVMHWDGAAWTARADELGAAEMWAIDGTSASDVWVAGDQQGVRHWDGTAWGAADLNARLVSIDATSTTSAWGCGQYGDVWRYDGTWQMVPITADLPDVSNLVLYTVFSTGPDHAIVVGKSGVNDGTIFVYDGAWTKAALDTVAGQGLAVFGVSADDVWATMQNGQTYHYDGTAGAWTDRTAAGPLMGSANANDLHGLPSGVLWAASNTGRIHKYTP